MLAKSGSLESPNRIETEKKKRILLDSFLTLQYLLNIKITLWPDFMSLSFLDLAMKPILCTSHLISNTQVGKTHFWVLIHIYRLAGINNPEYGDWGQNVKCM